MVRLIRRELGLPPQPKAKNPADSWMGRLLSQSSDAIRGGFQMLDEVFKVLLPAIPMANAQESCDIGAACDKVPDAAWSVDEFLETAQALGFEIHVAQSLADRADASLKGVTIMIGDTHSDAKLQGDITALVQKHLRLGTGEKRGDRLLIEFSASDVRETDESTPLHREVDFRCRGQRRSASQEASAPTCIGVKPEPFAEQSAAKHLEFVKASTELLDAAGFSGPEYELSHLTDVPLLLSQSFPDDPRSKAYRNAFAAYYSFVADNFKANNAHFMEEIERHRSADEATFIILGRMHVMDMAHKFLTEVPNSIVVMQTLDEKAKQNAADFFHLQAQRGVK